MNLKKAVSEKIELIKPNEIDFIIKKVIAYGLEMWRSGKTSLKSYEISSKEILNDIRFELDEARGRANSKLSKRAYGRCEKHYNEAEGGEGIKLVRFKARCYICEKETRQAKKEKYQDRLKAMGAVYRERHREKAKMSNKIYRKLNSEKIREYNTRWREKNLEKSRSYGRNSYHKRKNSKLESLKSESI